MKVTTSTLRWATALCCAAGMLLLTPASYAGHRHSNIRLTGEDKEQKEPSKDKDRKHQKDDTKKDDSNKDESEQETPEKGDS